MKLTQKQQETVDRFLELESEYGKGNVFLRWINDYWKVCFVIHKIEEEIYKPLLSDCNRVNGKIINSLEEKGLLTCCDNKHNEDVTPNSWNSQPEGWGCVGSRIKTELLSE